MIAHMARIIFLLDSTTVDHLARAFLIDRPWNCRPSEKRLSGSPIPSGLGEDPKAGKGQVSGLVQCPGGVADERALSLGSSGIHSTVILSSS